MNKYTRIVYDMEASQVFKAFIDGQAGTAGLQLRDRLIAHPFVELIEIEDDMRKDERRRSKLMDEADVVFLCLPDAEARRAVELVKNPNAVVIDTSTAHRVEKGWAYGFSELSENLRDGIKSSKRIANPGCHATGFISIAYPLVKLGIVGNDYPFTCHSITGFSGGGKKMIAQYKDENRDASYSSPRQYALGQTHKHLPEMKAVPSLVKEPIFDPIVCDFYSGMAVTVPIFLDGIKKTFDEIMRSLTEFYADSRLIKVLPAPLDGFIPANMLSGRDDMVIFLAGNENRMTITSVFDNLGKGASGAAVQNMNIALGLDDITALRI